MKTLIARLFNVWVELSQNWDTNEIATKKKSLQIDYFFISNKP